MKEFDYLVRFADRQGRIYYGEATLQDLQSSLVGQRLRVYQGDHPWDNNFELSEHNRVVAKV